MTLTTHAVWGAVAAVALRQEPALGLATALLSHYLLDAIPHWNYSVLSLKRAPGQPLEDRVILGKKMLLDLARTGADCGLGLAMVAAMLAKTPAPELGLGLAGAIIGVLPDSLQFLYGLSHSPLLKPHQIFHGWMHAQNGLENKPILGSIAQLAIVAVALFLLSLYR